MEENVVVEQPKTKSGLRWGVVVGGVVFGLLMLGGGLWLGKMMYAPPSDIKPVAVVFPIPTLVPADPVANWKTYSTNEFTFKYPQGWQVGQPAHFPDTYILQPSATFNAESQKDRVSVSVSESCLNTQCLTVFDLDGYVKQWGFKIVGQSDVDNMKADKVLLPNGDTGYIMVKDKSAITISTDKYYTELDQILSTFKFTDKTTSVDDWKSYTGTKFGIMINYPAGWYVNEKYPWMYISKEKLSDSDWGLTHGLPGSFEVFAEQDPQNIVGIQNQINNPQPVKDHNGTEYSTVEKIVVDGVAGIKEVQYGEADMASVGGYITSILLKKGNMYLVINYPDQYNKSYDYKIYDQIMASLKFTK